MNRVLRALVTCLLLVAVPLQGYAAGSMLFCGAGVPASSGTAHHDGAGHIGPHQHDADHGAAVSHEQSAMQDMQAVAAPGDDTGNVHGLAHGKCSVCSSCCSAAALPTALIDANTAAPHAAAFLHLEHVHPGDGPARIERPPRPHLV